MQIQEAAATNMLMTPDDDPSQFEGEPIRAKERGLENVIYVDWHRRGLFNDHFLGVETTRYLFESVQYPEQGNFVDQQYEFEVTQDDDAVNVRLWRDGNVWIGQVHLPVRVEKTFTLKNDETSLKARYVVTNLGDIELNSRFGIELAFGFDGGDNPQYCHLEAGDANMSMGESHELQNISHYRAVTQIRRFAVDFTLEHPATLWSFPLAPITLSDGGFERVHQGVVTMPIWNIKLGPSESWTADIQLDISDLS